MMVKKYNDIYKGNKLSRIAFPMGGIGAGMICLEGTGCLSHVSIRNKPEVYNEPYMYSAVSITKEANIAKVLEGPLPMWKLFGSPETARKAQTPGSQQHQGHRRRAGSPERFD